MIAEWLSNRAEKYFSLYKQDIIKILEPSCGDGVFVDAIESSFRCERYRLDAVEISIEALDSANRTERQNVSLFNDDFLFWQPANDYDLVIGNPPYIARKRLDQEQAKKCKEIHLSHGLDDREVSNIWTSFVVKSSAMLSDSGMLAFVLPTELLQVNYAKEIRKFLLEEYHRLEIISFKSLAFQDIEQDTVILIAYKNTSMEKGLFFAEVSDIQQLRSQNLNFLGHHGDHNAKWSSYILSEEDMLFIDTVASKFKRVSDYCKSVAGIVTAANSFFILPTNKVKTLKLSRYVKKIVQKGMLVNGAIEISQHMYDEISKSGKPCYLIDLNGIPESEFHEELVTYLDEGLHSGINERYKCKLRERWFDVPTIWRSEGVFFKRGHLYPKLMVNNADVYVTDSAYRIKMNEEHDIESLTYSFYNSLTLLFSELNGRYYGGGVLELTPNEFKSLPIPFFKINKKEFNIFSEKFNNKKSIDEILRENNKKILSNCELSDDEIDKIHNIYVKVKNRRLRID